MKGNHYKKASIDFSVPLMFDLIDKQILADDPKNFDPVFVFKLNSKNSNSSKYSQYHVTYANYYYFLKIMIQTFFLSLFI